jgi:hypothetical protein
MKPAWMRLSVAVGVLVVLAAGVWALAAPNPNPPPSVIKCTQAACTGPCDMSQWTSGYCSVGKSGQPFQATENCCCCGADAKNHWFHGE